MAASANVVCGDLQFDSLRLVRAVIAAEILAVDGTTAALMTAFPEAHCHLPDRLLFPQSSSLQVACPAEAAFAAPERTKLSMKQKLFPAKEGDCPGFLDRYWYEA